MISRVMIDQALLGTLWLLCEGAQRVSMLSVGAAAMHLKCIHGQQR